MKQTLLLIAFSLLSLTLFSQGIVYDGKPPKRKYPYTTTIQLRNCSYERRVVSFNSSIQFFKMWIYGQHKFETNKVLFFSNDYIVDSAYLRQGVANIRKALPKNFWVFPMGEKWYDSEPNQDSIWFIQMFVQIDKIGNVKIFAAYKMTFEGTDARIDKQRANPKINNIEFILDKQKLRDLEIKLKSSPESL